MPWLTMAMVPSVQTYAAPAVQTFAAPAVQSFAAQSFVAPQAVGLNVGYSGLNVGATSSDAAIVGQILSAMNGPAPAARVQAAASNGPSNNMALQAAAAAADKAAALEAKVDAIDARLLSVEKRLKALCETR